MKLYELDYLIAADIPEEKRSSIDEKIKSSIEKEGGDIKKAETSSEIDLAYEIENTRKAFLFTVIFNLKAEKINSIIEEIKKEDKILRHLVFKKKEVEEKEKKRLKEIVKKPKSEKKDKKKDKAELEKIEKKLEEILEE